MEHPLRRNELDPNQPFEGDAGALGKRQEVPHMAGHILLHETPHGGEITLNGQQKQEQQFGGGPAFRPVSVPKNVVAPPSAETMPQAVAENGGEPAPAKVEHSAWHTININEQGQVMQQEYGQAFHQEQLAETGQTQSLVGKMNPSAIAMQQQLPTITSTPVSSDGKVEPVRTSKVPVNPLYATAAQKQHEPDQAVPPTSVPTVPTDPFPAVQSSQPQAQDVASSQPQAQPVQPFSAGMPPLPQQPFMPAMPFPQQEMSQQPQNPIAMPQPPVPQAAPEHQYMSTSPMGVGAQPTYAQPMQPQVQLQNAVNPSFVQPALPPVVQDPQLPAGKPTHVDPQHLLPAAKHRVRNILTSPWLWLAVGVLMILYFAPSLFSS